MVFAEQLEQVSVSESTMVSEAYETQQSETEQGSASLSTSEPGEEFERESAAYSEFFVNPMPMAMLSETQRSMLAAIDAARASLQGELHDDTASTYAMQPQFYEKARALSQAMLDYYFYEQGYTGQMESGMWTTDGHNNFDSAVLPVRFTNADGSTLYRYFGFETADEEDRVLGQDDFAWKPMVDHIKLTEKQPVFINANGEKVTFSVADNMSGEAEYRYYGCNGDGVLNQIRGVELPVYAIKSRSATMLTVTPEAAHYGMQYNLIGFAGKQYLASEQTFANRPVQAEMPDERATSEANLHSLSESVSEEIAEYESESEVEMLSISESVSEEIAEYESESEEEMLSISESVSEEIAAYESESEVEMHALSESVSEQIAAYESESEVEMHALSESVSEEMAAYESESEEEMWSISESVSEQIEEYESESVVEERMASESAEEMRVLSESVSEQMEEYESESEAEMRELSESVSEEMAAYESESEMEMHSLSESVSEQMEEYESESEVERRSLSESVSEQMEEYESESISEQMEEYESESESVAASLTPRRMVSADIEDEVVPLAVLAEEGEESANTIQMIDEE